MAIQKDKLIEEAQRIALRGQTDRAIQLYQQVVAADPSGLGNRQRLADLLARTGRTGEARAQLEAIAGSYTANGFYLKAIAVHKKLQTIFPDDIGITLSIADLNQRHGLTGNALAEYEQAYRHYRTNGSNEQCVEILEKMHGVEPRNARIRLLLAETYLQCGRQEEAFGHFSRLAALYHEKGDHASRTEIENRIRQLFPERSSFRTDVIAEQIAVGNVDAAVLELQSLLKENPAKGAAWELLIRAYRILGQPRRVRLACQHYLAYCPRERSARLHLLRCLLAEGDAGEVLTLLEQHREEFLTDLTCTGAEEFLPSLEQLALRSPALRDWLRPLRVPEAAVPAQPPEPAEPASATPEPESVPADLFAPLDTAVAASAPVMQAAPDEEVEVEIEIDLDDDLFLPAEGIAGPAPVQPAAIDGGAAARSVRFGSGIEASDAQSHQDLGVAFKEMGLYDEAITELREAAVDPARSFVCLLLQAACLREKGDLAAAEKLLREMMQPDMAINDLCSVKYELALVLEAGDRTGDAETLLAEIAMNPGFREVLQQAGRQEADPLDFSEEELLGFDLKPAKL